MILSLRVMLKLSRAGEPKKYSKVFPLWNRDNEKLNKTILLLFSSSFLYRYFALFNYISVSYLLQSKEAYSYLTQRIFKNLFKSGICVCFKSFDLVLYIEINWWEIFIRFHKISSPTKPFHDAVNVTWISICMSKR